MPPAPPPPSRYCGLYRCTTDGLLYQVSHTDSKRTALQLQRRAPHEAAWRPACETTESHIKRLLDYGSFQRHDT